MLVLLLLDIVEDRRYAYAEYFDYCEEYAMFVNIKKTVTECYPAFFP